MRALVLFVALSILSGCNQPVPPRPTSAARPEVPTLAPTYPSAKPTVTPPTPQPSSPFGTDYFDYQTTEGVLADFVGRLSELYDGADDAALDRLFTVNGRTSAISYDWRLRGAVRGETSFRGRVSLRGFSTTVEEPRAIPPRMTANIALLVAPGAELVDVATGETLQRWDVRQDYSLQVELRFDVSAADWEAAAVGPPVEFWDEPPGDPGPPVRCGGLGPDRSDAADPVAGRRWCFGGRNGTLASPEQVTSWRAFRAAKRAPRS